MKTLIAALTLLAAAGSVLAQATPVGLWKTIGDETQAEKSLLRITESGGLNKGKVYMTRLKPVEGGKVLEVRGDIGPF